MLGRIHGLVRGLAPALLLLALVATWARAGVPEGLTPEQVDALEQRVQARWQALTARDYDRAWEFCTSAYRQVFGRDLYRLQFSYAVDRKLTGVEVVAYDRAAAVASVTARVMSKPLKQTSAASVSLGAVPVSVHEKWILSNGEWWYSAGD